MNLKHYKHNVSQTGTNNHVIKANPVASKNHDGPQKLISEQLHIT